MNNKAINTLAYTGVVTLSQYIGSKKIKILQTHNEGGNPLFDFLADCLTGDFSIARYSKPNKVKLVRRKRAYTDAGDAYFKYESESDFYYLISKPEKVYDGTKSVVRYSFMIPRDIIGNRQFEGLGLGLYADTIKNVDADLAKFSAYCDLNLTTNSIIDSALVVDWELTFSNISSSKING